MKSFVAYRPCVTFSPAKFFFRYAYEEDKVVLRILLEDVVRFKAKEVMLLRDKPAKAVLDLIDDVSLYYSAYV